MSMMSSLKQYIQRLDRSGFCRLSQAWSRRVVGRSSLTDSCYSYSAQGKQKSLPKISVGRKKENEDRVKHSLNETISQHVDNEGKYGKC